MMSSIAKHASLTLALGCAAAFPTVAHAAAFINGDFESPGGAYGDRTDLVGGGADYVTGWHAEGGNTTYDIGAYAVAHSGAAYLHFGNLGASGTVLSQTFDTVIGQTYSVTYFLRTLAGPVSNQALSASIESGGSTILVNNTISSVDWVAGNAIEFVAGANFTTLSFSDTVSANAANIGLDSVSVSPQFASGVPEPATWALMIAGLGAVGAARRRRPARFTFTKNCELQAN